QKAFFDELLERLTVKQKEPAYKLLHLLFTHPPIIITAAGEFAGEELPPSRRNIINQATVSMGYFIDFLHKLKALGVYDSSLIVLHADHGNRRKIDMLGAAGDSSERIPHLERMAGSAMPLMLIKPPHSTRPLTVSEAHTQLTDLPATIATILGFAEEFDGLSMFADELGEPGEARERRYFNYRWQRKYWRADYMDKVNEYRIQGSVFDRASWRPGPIHRPPESLAPQDAGRPSPNGH
ncbi:MAG: hypothetical protein GY720_11525, partial [bacterium]|nr:hypothetical protein [bacterium]